MEVILLEKVQNLGALGEKVRVKPGYARNFLIPKGKAAQATKANLEAFEKRRAELEKAQADTLAAAQARAATLEGVRVRVARRAGDEGRLFGSVGTTDIVEAAVAAGHEVHKNEVRLPEGPLRQVGEFSVALHLHADVNAHITVEVVPEA
jgi:large subunit ribosomal protein L9